MTASPATPPGDLKRIPSGVPGFDAMIQGGFLVQFVAEGLRRGGAALVVLTSLPRARFQDALRAADANPDRALEERRLRFVEWAAGSDEGGPPAEADGGTF